MRQDKHYVDIILSNLSLKAFGIKKALLKGPKGEKNMLQIRIIFLFLPHHV